MTAQLHFLRPGLALVIAGLLAACTPPMPDTGVTSRLNAPFVEAQHQYHFARGSGALSSSERGGINRFLSSLSLREGDVVIVTIPTSGSARTDALRRETMQAALAMIPSRVQLGMEESFATRPLQPRQVGLLRVARAKGIEVDCKPTIDDLGCANAINLAVMIHEPGDVLAPAVTARTAQR